jgi:hypothetical protein
VRAAARGISFGIATTLTFNIPVTLARQIGPAAPVFEFSASRAAELEML